MQYGITETVKTIYTKTKVIDVINEIAKKKFNAIRNFLEGEEFKEAVIFGVYLWGTYVASNLVKYSDKVYLVDIHEFMKNFISNGNIKFLHLNEFKLKLMRNEINPDLIIDLTGLGGIEPEFLSKFDPEVFIVEDPKGVFDEDIYETDNTYEKANIFVEKAKVGVLKTYRKARVSKTSGTMTLTIDTIVDAAKEIISLDGVLYAIPNLRYYEGILFHEKDSYKFLSEISQPAITISTLNDVLEESEKILSNNINLIHSFVEKL
ncbi:SAM-dependent methyltransferase HcgC family protein [Methanocaldococcus sp.]